MEKRSYGEMEHYSARPQNYLTAHVRRATYANVMPGPHEAEKELFPGILIVMLALVAAWPPVSAFRIAYTLGLVFAFELSLGMHGYSFPALASHLLPFRALRVPARASMLVGLSLAVLAGWGLARLQDRLRRPWLKAALATALCAVVLFESRATVSLEPVPPPHPIYRWFDGRPASVIADCRRRDRSPRTNGRTSATRTPRRFTGNGC